MKKAKSALISVFHKDGLEPIIRQLHKDGVKLYSTGGTQQYIESLKNPRSAGGRGDFLSFDPRRARENAPS